MKKLIALFLFSCGYATMQACPVCEKQQPKLLRGITHGAGPQSNWDWIIVGMMLLVTVLVFFYSVKFLLKPGEKNPRHIKQTILQSF